MSGHSKWTQIKRQKGATDAKRGQLFTKLGREITVAAREGGGDQNANSRLRLAIQRAKDQNMPADNIERAIKRGTGELEGGSLDEVVYEGYGPGGAAILLEVLTDNRNRTVSEIRSAMTRHGGSLGEAGCVAWLFEQKGIVVAEAPDGRDEDLALLAIDAGAEDVNTEDSALEVYTAPQNVETVRRALETEGATVRSSEVAMVPKTTLALEEKDAIQAIRLLERLDELDDVQRVHTNAEFPNELLERIRG